MIRFRTCLRLATALLVAATVSQASPARATFQLALQEAGKDFGAGVGNLAVVASAADFTALSVSGTFGDFTVTILGGASDNAADLSDLLSATVAVKNNSGTTATLKMYITQTNYTLPAGTKLAVESSLGGTVNNGTLGLTNIFQAYADKNNNAFGLSDFTNGPQTATASGSSFDTGSANGTFTRGASNYSLTSVVTFSLGGGSKANFSDHINVTPTPAPAGLLLFVSGVPAMAVVWLRRRKAQVQKS